MNDIREDIQQASLNYSPLPGGKENGPSFTPIPEATMTLKPESESIDVQTPVEYIPSEDLRHVEVHPTIVSVPPELEEIGVVSTGHPVASTPAKVQITPEMEEKAKKSKVSDAIKWWFGFIKRRSMMPPVPVPSA